MAYELDEKRAYQRAWVNRRRSQWIADNGPCAECGATQNLEVDHVDPATKAMKPSVLWSLAPDNPKRVAELAKCQVLCYSCHKRKTAGEMNAGEANGCAKLTDQAVRLIRASEGETYGVLAQRFGVTRSTIGRVRRGENWRTVALARSPVPVG